MCLCAAYPVQVSGHQLVTVPASIYQTVMANMHQERRSQNCRVSNALWGKFCYFARRIWWNFETFPASGSVSQRYGSGSGFGSFYHQAKIVRTTLIPTVLWLLFDFLSLKNDVNVPSKSNKRKFFYSILLASWKLMKKITGSGSRSGSISQRHGSADPDPYQNATNLQYCFALIVSIEIGERKIYK